MSKDVMSLKLCVIRSGSSGNCTAIWSDTTGIFVDAGMLDPCGIIKALDERDIPIRNFRGIIVTHGHSDHIGETTEEISLKYGVPIYAHKKTISAARKRLRNIARLESRQLIRYFSRRTLYIGDLQAKPFPVPHYGCGNPGKPFGFCVSHENHSGKLKIGFITDLGSVSDRVINYLRGSRAIVIETNHDEELVRKGDRYNKGWVLSPEGHLSNSDAGKAILKLMDRSLNTVTQKLRYVFLAHMSHDHNSPGRALSQLKKSIGSHHVKKLKFNLTHQDRPSRVVSL